MAGLTATYKCLRCKEPFVARLADRKRGWARYCSKSCKAIRQTQVTGYAGPKSHGDGEYADAYEDAGWDAHKDWLR